MGWGREERGHRDAPGREPNGPKTVTTAGLAQREVSSLRGAGGSRNPGAAKAVSAPRRTEIILEVLAFGEAGVQNTWSLAVVTRV